jgi:hypothetical protein
MMKKAPELMGDCISDIEAFDELARFFDTQSADVGDILARAWALANRYLVGRADMNWQAAFPLLFANSPLFVEQVERIFTDSDACSGVAPRALTVVQMLTEALINDSEVI